MTAQLLLREKLLGLAMPPCERKQQEAVVEDDREGELSEEEVWEVASSASKLEDGLKQAAKTESFAVQVSRSSNDHDVDEAMESSQGSSLSRVIAIPARTRSSNPNRVKLLRYASAPMKVPEWPRASARNIESFITREEMEDGDAVGDDGDHDNQSETGQRLPPHLITARQNSMVASSSVMEGAGRTLKGRDLRNVRNAVWECTGFIG